MYKFFKIIIVLILMNNILSSFVFANEDYKYVRKIHNLLVIGIDEENNESLESVMILTVDGIDKKLKLISISTDNELKTGDTIKESYKYKNENEFESLLEDNFKININSYVVINKSAMKRIVEVINGIEFDNKLIDGKEASKLFIEQKKGNQVIQGIIDKLATISFSKYPNIILSTYDYVILNMELYDMMSLAFTVLQFDSYKAIEFKI